jgi:hypothetical protein
VTELKEDIMCAAYPRLLCALGIVGVASLFAPTQPALAQDGPEWIVTEISGDVHAQSASGMSPSLARGSVLEAGRTIETGPGARLVLMHGKDLVTVSPNSEFRIPPSADPGERINFIQTLGTILYRVEHRPARGFEVDTPALAAVVKGTVFTVTAGKTADSVHVAGGAVQVTSLTSHQVALVHPGEVAVVSLAGRDLTILGKPTPSKTLQRHSENNDPDDEALGTSASAAAPARVDAGAPVTTAAATAPARADDGAQVTSASASAPTSDKPSGAPQAGPHLTRTMGEEHLDIAALTKGLLGDEKERGRGLYFAAVSSDGQEGQLPLIGANALASNPNASGASANTSGGTANALGGSAGAVGGSLASIGVAPSVGGAVPNVVGGVTNVVGGVTNVVGGVTNVAGNTVNTVTNTVTGITTPVLTGLNTLLQGRRK